MSEKIKGYSDKRDRHGHLTVAYKRGQKGPRYLKVPYSLLMSQDFLELSPMAIKLFLLLLRNWRTDKPDINVTVSYQRLRELCTKLIPDGNGTAKSVKPSNTTISKAIGELEKAGFIHKDVRHKKCNDYWIGQKWFTGEYK
jgi:hypothetical protein